jgi:hypothetical protein
MVGWLGREDEEEGEEEEEEMEEETESWSSLRGPVLTARLRSRFIATR